MNKKLESNGGGCGKYGTAKKSLIMCAPIRKEVLEDKTVSFLLFLPHADMVLLHNLFVTSAEINH